MRGALTELFDIESTKQTSPDAVDPITPEKVITIALTTPTQSCASTTQNPPYIDDNWRTCLFAAVSTDGRVQHRSHPVDSQASQTALP